MTGIKHPKTLFVSGGMSGLGRALAREYLQRGADVAIFDLVIKDDVLQELEMRCAKPLEVGCQTKFFEVHCTFVEDPGAGKVEILQAATAELNAFFSVCLYIVQIMLKII